MKCYGESYVEEKPACQRCELAEYCKDARFKPSTREKSYANVYLNHMVEEQSDQPATPLCGRSFSYADILGILRYLVSLPQPVLRALDCILRDSAVSGEAKLSALAKRLGISRQAVWGMINRNAENHPELKKIFLYRRKKK